MFTAGIITTILATVLHLIVRAEELDVLYLAGILKMTASTGFLATAVAAGALRSRSSIVLLAGLVFSWFGDLFLIGSGPNYFLAGLVSFFAGHLCYCVSFAMRRLDMRLAGAGAAALLLPGYLLASWILPNVKDPALQGPVVAYMCVITIMLAMATGCLKRPGGRWMFAGALLFYFSDIFVARAAFVSPGFINSLFGLPLYFGGQLLLAASIAYALNPQSDAEKREK